MEFWNNFKGQLWKKEINVRDFIQENYTPYHGDDSFLVDSTEKTKKVWSKLTELFKVEREKGIYDAETKFPQGITTYGPGYIDKDSEVIVGLQTDAPLKRGIFPKGGLRMVKNSLEAYGYQIDPLTEEIFTKYRKTHNEGVFSAYTDEIRAARKSGIITGLPDAYGRGRIIGDYRRVALYGVNRLIEDKKEQLKQLEAADFNEDVIRKREEVSDQIKALKEFIEMCASYGFDVTRPAKDAKEAVQFLYFAYLAATKDQDGAAMSLGRTSTFLDIYIERDLKNVLAEKGYKVVNTPKTANYWLQINILKLEKLSLNNSDAALSGLTGAGIGALLGGYNTGSANTAVAWGLVGGALGILSDALVDDTFYGMITDILVSERTPYKVKSSAVSATTQGTQRRTPFFNRNQGPCKLQRYRNRSRTEKFFRHLLTRTRIPAHRTAVVEQEPQFEW